MAISQAAKAAILCNACTLLVDEWAVVCSIEKGGYKGGRIGNFVAYTVKHDSASHPWVHHPFRSREYNQQLILKINHHPWVEVSDIIGTTG